MATKKPPVLDIKRELSAVDKKDYNFYDNLNDDEKKAFSPYLLMRYVSNVQGDRDTQEWFLEMTNEFVNKDFSSIGKDHRPLYWKLFAAIGTGVTAFHPYLAAGKKEKAVKIEKLLAELYPARKLSDIKLQASLMTKQDKEELFDMMGFDKKQRKEYE
jgi:hypothetical protein